MAGLHDLVVSLLLISLLALPTVWFLPSFFTSFLDTLRSLLTSLLYLITGTTLVLVVLGVALVGEKAVRRWKGEVATGGGMGEQEKPESLRAAGRHDVEYLRARADNKLDRAADKLIDKLETSSVGKLLRRKVKGSKADKGKGRADEVELSDLRRSEAASTGVRRMPPPPPPLPPR